MEKKLYQTPMTTIEPGLLTSQILETSPEEQYTFGGLTDANQTEFDQETDDFLNLNNQKNLWDD